MNNEWEFETKLRLLQEVINKKKAALTAILTICENQEQLFLSPPSDTRREFLLETGKEKQILIDETMVCDEVFQRTFDSISAVFEAQSKHHKDAACHLQATIKEVVEIDVRIRAQEQKARMLAKESFGQPTDTVNPASTNYILEQYRNNTKK